MASAEPSGFEGILASFKKRLSPEHVELFQLTTFDDLKASITRIQKEQAAKKSLRNLNKIKPFLNGLKQYAGVLEVFVQIKPEILAFIWGPVKLCIQIASKLNEAFDALLDAYERIGNSLPILSIVDTLFYSHPHVKKVLADIYEDILDFHKRAIVFFKHGTWKLTFKLTYHTFTDMFEDILKKLDRSRDLLLQSANLAHFQDSQEARIRFTRGMEVLLDGEQNQRRKAIMDWLSSELSSKVQHQELQKIRAMLPQTTRWIFSQPQILDWLKGADYAPCGFWLCGIPGAGKTVIFSSIVDEIRTTIPGAQVIYFYCKNSDPLRSHFIDIAKSFISQILQLNPNCLDFLYESMLANGERRAKDAGNLLHILDQILTNHDSLYIGIDGLDECSEEERKLVSDLIAVCSRANEVQGNIRIFITSRQEKDIERSLISAFKFNIKPQNLEDDITAYITFKMAELSQIFNFTPEREQLITKEICTRPKGMFLLARLIMDNLLSQYNLDDLNEELRFEVLPHGINEAYGRMLVRIGKASSQNPRQLEKCLQRAKVILTLVTTSQRALYIHEIQGALSINLEEKNVDFGNRHSRFPLDDLCGPIIQAAKNGIVDLIHPTAKEYLWQHHSGYYIKASGAEELMTTLCASYLTFDCFSPGLAKDRFAARVLSGDLAFQEYAACNWLKHLECFFQSTSTEAAVPKNLKEAILTLQERHGIESTGSSRLNLSLLCKRNFCEILCELKQLYDHTDTIIAEDSKAEQMPYLLAQVSHSRSVIESQALENTEQNSLGKFYGNSPFRCPVLQCPYFVTGFENHKEREKHHDSHKRSFMCPYDTCDYSVFGLSSESALKTHISLCHGDLTSPPVFPDIKARTLEQALEDAIAANNLLAITDLAKELASFPERKKGFVLQALTLGNREAALKLLDLLGTPSELDYANKKSAALLKVCEIGDEELFDILVERGVNINIGDDNSDENPLTVASKNCHLSIIRKLLGRGDYDRKNSHASYSRKGALVMASTYGHVEVVSLLLEKDSNYFGKKIPIDFNRALNAAIKGQNISCAKVILNWALDKDSSLLPTKVRKISPGNIDHMIETLSAEQAKIIEEGGGTKGNALQAMARKGDCEAVLHLLDLGADIDNLAGEYGTPVMAAASNGKLDMIKLLIERGADVRKKDDRRDRKRNYIRGSAIDVAAVRGHETIVQVLLGSGAVLAHESLHKKFLDRFTVLQALSKRVDSANLIRLILEKGASVDAVAGKEWGYEQRRPLKIAVEEGVDVTVQLLLEYGADINAEDEDGNTALHHAARRGKSETLEILLDHGADINAINKQGEKVLDIGCKYLSKEQCERVLRILVQRGADLNAKNKKGDPLLHYAANQEEPDLLETLLDHGADINAINANGETALFSIPIYKNFGAQYQQNFRILVERGADVNATDKTGDPALHYTIKNGEPDLLEALLDHGADINAINAKGETALMVGEGCFWDRKYQGCFRILVKRGADVDMVDKDGNTALMVVSSQDELSAVEILVDKGAEICTRNVEGLTALMIAAGRAHFSIVEYLLQQRTNQNIEEFEEVESAAELAIRKGHVEIARILLDYLRRIGFTNDQHPTLKFWMDFMAQDMISLLKEYSTIVELKTYRMDAPIMPKISSGDEFSEDD